MFGAENILLRILPAACLPLGIALLVADATISSDGTTISLGLFISAITATVIGTLWLAALKAKIRRQHREMQDQIDECRRELALPVKGDKPRWMRKPPGISGEE